MKLPDTINNMFSTKNVGAMDRLLRAVPTIIVTVLIIQGRLSGPVAWIAGVLAVMLLLTSILGSCSIYYLLGISSCRARKSV